MNFLLVVAKCSNNDVLKSDFEGIPRQKTKPSASLFLLMHLLCSSVISGSQQEMFPFSF